MSHRLFDVQAAHAKRLTGSRAHNHHPACNNKHGPWRSVTFHFRFSNPNLLAAHTTARSLSNGASNKSRLKLLIPRSISHQVCCLRHHVPILQNRPYHSSRDFVSHQTNFPRHRRMNKTTAMAFLHPNRSRFRAMYELYSSLVQAAFIRMPIKATINQRIMMQKELEYTIGILVKEEDRGQMRRERMQLHPHLQLRMRD